MFVSSTQSYVYFIIIKKKFYYMKYLYTFEVTAQNPSDGDSLMTEKTVDSNFEYTASSQSIANQIIGRWSAKADY